MGRRGAVPGWGGAGPAAGVLGDRTGVQPAHSQGSAQGRAEGCVCRRVCVKPPSPLPARGFPHLRNTRTGWSGPRFLPLPAGSLRGRVTCLAEGARPRPDAPLARPLWL